MRKLDYAGGGSTKVGLDCIARKTEEGLVKLVPSEETFAHKCHAMEFSELSEFQKEQVLRKGA